MKHGLHIAVCAACLLYANTVSAQTAPEKILPLDGHIAPIGSRIELNWFDAQPPRVGSVTVKRRKLGQIGGGNWEEVFPSLGPVMLFPDAAINPGVAYEYQVLRSARDIVDVGYWIAGTEIPAQEFRGTAHLLVDETVSQDIAPRLARFERDLVGDGWVVLRHDVPRGASSRPVQNLNTARSIKDRLREHYFDDPFGQHVAILIGHVPVVFSGLANPDGHEPVPHASDLFYAEMDGEWRAALDGVLLQNQVPSDFIEMQIGRIDFSNLSGGDRNRELHLLRSYFDKNHHWRMQFLGDLRNAYGQSKHLSVERAGLRNIVGAASVTEGGHHDVGEQHPWLWGVDFGDYSGGKYAQEYENKAVFTINFGSGKQRFERPNNPMTALLAQPWYTIATGWGGRPAWWLHLMALGGTIGEVHLRTINNGFAGEPYRETMDYYPTGAYMFRNPIWVNLLGDPTAHAFPMGPPSHLTAEETDRGVKLSWTPSTDPDVTGYKIYRAAAGSLRFTPLTQDVLTTPDFLDLAPEKNARYMVRSYGLKHVYAGSFHTFSQGAFSDKRSLSETQFANDMTIAAPAGQPVSLPDVFRSDNSNPIYALIREPSVGHVSHNGINWVYTPPTGFTGSVQLQFSVSTTFQTDTGLLTIKVGD